MKNKIKAVIRAISKGKTGEIFISGDIGETLFGEGVTAKQFHDELKSLGDIDLLNLSLFSPGGNVFEGIAIYNMIDRHPARVVVNIEGLAASIAAVIAMSGDEIRIPANAMMMIHNPMGGAFGYATELRKVADDLDKVEKVITDTYIRRTGQPESVISDLMDEETWLTADDAVSYGLADIITDEVKMAAHVDLSRFRNVPKNLSTALYSIKPANKGRLYIKDELLKRKLLLEGFKK